MAGRCNCPHYLVPSADPSDSIGCPVHDPNYVDPQTAGFESLIIQISKLKAHLARAEHLNTLCAVCTPGRDHNGTLCRQHADEKIMRLTNRLAAAEEVIKFYADEDLYYRSECYPRKYHSMYDTRDDPSDAEKEEGAKARAYFEEEN